MCLKSKLCLHIGCSQYLKFKMMKRFWPLIIKIIAFAFESSGRLELQFLTIIDLDNQSNKSSIY